MKIYGILKRNHLNSMQISQARKKTNLHLFNAHRSSTAMPLIVKIQLKQMYNVSKFRQMRFH